LPMENISRYFADYQCLDIEVPGQYLTDREPFVEQHEKIMCFMPEVDVIRRNQVSCRRISLRSNTGKVYKFLIQSTPPTHPTCFNHSEDRTWSLMHQINRLFANDRGPSMDDLSIHI